MSYGNNMPINGVEKMEYKIFGNAQSSENPIIIVSENILSDKMS